MASGPITSWETDGETVSDFILGGSKVTADGDCSHEMKRCLLLGRKVMTNLDIIFKSRDVTLPTKVHLVKAMVFPVVMYGCESWTVKKAECRRIDALNCGIGEDCSESHGWRSLVDYSPRGRKESDMTERLHSLTHSLKAMVFPVVMYGCESWTVKKAERRRIDAFELWCWRRLLRVP